MRTVFVDTAALIALGDKSDSFHQQALSVRDRLKKSRTVFATTNAVILELAGYFSQSGKRSVAVELTDHHFEQAGFNILLKSS